MNEGIKKKRMNEEIKNKIKGRIERKQKGIEEE